jgi:hypothetical protein
MSVTVTVHPHQNIRAAMRAYRRSLPGTREQRAATARAHWNAFVARVTADIVAARGEPPAHLPDSPDFGPRARWWAYPIGNPLVLVYVRHSARTGLFSWHVEAVAVEMYLGPEPTEAPLARGSQSSS